MIDLPAAWMLRDDLGRHSFDSWMLRGDLGRHSFDSWMLRGDLGRHSFHFRAKGNCLKSPMLCRCPCASRNPWFWNPWFWNPTWVLLIDSRGALALRGALQRWLLGAFHSRERRVCGRYFLLCTQLTASVFPHIRTSHTSDELDLDGVIRSKQELKSRNLARLGWTSTQSSRWWPFPSGSIV